MGDVGHQGSYSFLLKSWPFGADHYRGCWLAFWIMASGGGLTSCRSDVEVAGWLPGLGTGDSTGFPGQVAAGSGVRVLFLHMVWPLFVCILRISGPTWRWLGINN